MAIIGGGTCVTVVQDVYCGGGTFIFGEPLSSSSVLRSSVLIGLSADVASDDEFSICCRSTDVPLLLLLMELFVMLVVFALLARCCGGGAVWNIMFNGCV